MNANGVSDATPYPFTAAPAAVPDAPAQPTIVAGDAHATVTFVAPNDNGSAITRYDATCTSNNGGATGTNHDVASPIVVSGLTNGTTYTCTVTATNGMGTSS